MTYDAAKKGKTGFIIGFFRTKKEQYELIKSNTANNKPIKMVQFKYMCSNNAQ
jgi:hypothetical protein